jgi:transposase InsO family protein
MSEEREQVLADIAEARAAGARLKPCCEVVGLDVRTVQRWQRSETRSDQRRGPLSTPTNKLTSEERAMIVAIATSPEYRGFPPSQIVPLLADKGIYVGSESTFYRVLREEGLQHHRDNTKPAQHKRPEPLKATGPNQVWSWDITYLKGPVKGQFYYLYLFMDVWSRKIVGWSVESCESSETAAELMANICELEGIDPGQVALHSDNGSPMKGATMLATLQALGVVASFSRPSVSNDNPYSEALFRTLKYRPGYPSKPFASLEAARAWVLGFVEWYNERHLHSSIRYVTPSDRHSGADVALLEHRRAVYERARSEHPERWSGTARDWSRPAVVALNPYEQAKVLREAA